jgi:DNA-binding response OmpR family regulator
MARILVIEDDESIRLLYKRRLEMVGHQVIDAPDGDAGTRLYRADPTDLIITDIVMPGKEGIETIRELRRDFPEAKIIAVSGGGEAIAGSTCLQLAHHLGADRTFAKPINWGRLLDAVNDLVELQTSKPEL